MSERSCNFVTRNLSNFTLFLSPLPARCFYIQVTLLIASIYVSEYNCLMYVSSTVGGSDMCMTLCLVPMFTTAVLECRIFAYFLLIRERLMVINETIVYLKNDLDSSASQSKASEIKSSAFFIASELGSWKIDGKFSVVNGNRLTPEKVAGSFKSNFVSKLRTTMRREVQLVMQILLSSDDDRRMYVRDLEAAKNQQQRSGASNFHMRHTTNAQIVYTKLHEISNLISCAFGIQIIAIISVQFITLTTLMYTFTMNMTR